MLQSCVFASVFREQRVTALLVGILSGCSVLLTSVLKVGVLHCLCLWSNTYIISWYAWVQRH